MYRDITKDNWLLFAKANYDNPTLQTEEEFNDDIKRFKYLKRLFRKYQSTKELKVRLVVNHVIVLQNVFGAEAAITLMLYKIDQVYWPILKSVLKYLNFLYPHEFNDVKEDELVTELLKEL